MGYWSLVAGDWFFESVKPCSKLFYANGARNPGRSREIQSGEHSDRLLTNDCSTTIISFHSATTGSLWNLFYREILSLLLQNEQTKGMDVQLYFLVPGEIVPQ